MKTPIALALLAILAFATSPAAAVERACRPSLSNFYHCPDTSAPAPKPTPTTSTSRRACRPSVSNLWTCPETSRSRRRSVEASGRACRPSLSNGYSCPGTSSESGATPPRRRLRRRSADVGRACRMDTSAPAKGRPAPTNMRRKRWHGRIAPPTPLSGQTPGRISTTSAAPTITATPKLGPICVSRTRSPKAYARRRMKSILELKVDRGPPWGPWSATVHLTRPPYFVDQGAAFNR